MSKHVLYKVMDDYTRIINDHHPIEIVGLNCDTSLRSSLDVKQPLHELVWVNTDKDDIFYLPDEEPHLSRGFIERVFNITEDMNIDETRSEDNRSFDDITPYLYSPLPRHLPNIDKDLLILSAAFHGDIDRYARLRRPCFVGAEESCVIRGIYHSTMFAKWCSMQDSFLEKRGIQKAITARYIMSNDLSRVTPDMHESLLPYQIWYPSRANVFTYKELLRRKPDMAAAIARAAIVAGYATLLEEADFDPADKRLIDEATESVNPLFMAILHDRGKAKGVRVPEYHEHSSDRMPTRQNSFEPTIANATKDLSKWNPDNDHTFEMYDDASNIDFSEAELSIISPDQVKNHRIFRNVDWFGVLETYPDDVHYQESPFAAPEAERWPTMNFALERRRLI